MGRTRTDIAHPRSTIRSASNSVLVKALSVEGLIKPDRYVLEPRILLDAAGFETADTALDTAASLEAANWSKAHTPDAIETNVSDLVGLEDGIEDQTNSVVFIDAGLDDTDQLISMIDPSMEIILLNGDSDGVAQIAQALEGRSDIDRIHIMAHGSSGELQLGSGVLTQASMSSLHSQDLTTIRASLSLSADLLIYGCNFAAGPAGQSAVTALAGLTGADIAASDDITGSATLGGDWQLELQIGDIDQQDIIAAEAYQGIMAPLTISVSSEPINDNGTIIWENAGDIGGVAIDLHATIIDTDGSISNVSGSNAGDDPQLAINSGFFGGGSVTIQWEIFLAGTDTPATGSPNFTISDIDGLNSPNTLEGVAVGFDDLKSYTTASDTALDIQATLQGIEVSGTDSDLDDTPTGTSAEGPLRETAAINFSWRDVSSWEITYTVENANSGRLFAHDGDGDFTFADPNIILNPQIAIDADNDGIANDVDVDDDGDGILDTQEGLVEATLGTSGTWNISGNTAVTDLGNGVYVVATTTSSGGFTSGIFNPNGDDFWNDELAGEASLQGDFDFGSTITFEFQDADGNPVSVDQPLFHIDRLGGSAGGTANSALIGLATGAWTELEGTQDFSVSANTVTDGDAGENTPSRYSAESGSSGNRSTAAGSLSLDGSRSNFTITIGQNGATGLGVDGLEFILQAINPAQSRDTDLDGILDHLDLDSDNDGITDNVEAQASAQYRAPSGIDLNQDGLDDVYDTRNVSAGTSAATSLNVNAPVNTDGEDSADYLDEDSDNDGINDIAERLDGAPDTLTSMADTDGDGLLDIFEGSNSDDGFDANDENLSGAILNLGDSDNDTNADGSGAVAGEQDFDYRDNNAALIVNNDSNETNSGITLNVDAQNGLLANDTDADNDPLSITQFSVDGSTYNSGETVNLTEGSLTIHADGSYRFDPAPFFVGAVPVITYTATDGIHTRTASLSLNVNFQNTPPTARDDDLTTDEATQISGSVLADNGNGVDSDPNGHALTITQINGLSASVGEELTLASGALLTIQSDGSYSYNPNGQFEHLCVGETASDTFTYQVSDANGGSDTATVTVVISGINDAPQGIANAETTQEDTQVSGQVIISDVDGDSVTATLQEAAQNGTVTVNPNGSYTYTPNWDYNGTDQFVIRMDDGNGGTTDVTVNVTITVVSDAFDDAFSGDEDQVVSGDVSDNDTHTGLATYALNTGPANGELTFNADGTFSYQPDANFNGSDGFTYDVTDMHGDVETRTVSLTIRSINDAPVALDNGPVALVEDMIATGNVLGKDSDVDGDDLSVTGFQVDGDITVYAAGSTATIANIGTLTIGVDGEFTFTPEANYHGPVPFATYTVSDGTVSASAILTFDDVVSVNDIPVAQDDSFTIDEDTPSLSANLFADNGNGADADVDGDTITVSHVNGMAGAVGQEITLASGALLAVHSDGTFTYNPNDVFDNLGAGETASDQFTYQISDGAGGTETTSVSITITGSDDPLSITGLRDGAAPDTDGSVQESDLASGSTPDENGENISGSFTVSAPDGLDTITINGQLVTATQLANSASTAITIATANGSLAINGYSSLSGEIFYTYTLGVGVDHSGGDVFETISLLLADDDGDTISDNLVFLIVDDGPVANNDSDEVVNEAGNPSSIAYGNVVTGTEPDQDPNTSDGNADQIGVDANANPVTGVAAGSGVPSLTNIGVSISGSYGDLVLNADGSYSYTPDYASPAVASLEPQETVVDTFTYEIQDGDGGSATATLSISVVGPPAIIGLGDGTVEGTDGSVLESHLPDGTEEGGGEDQLQGTFILLAPNGVQSLSVDGLLVTEAQLLLTNTVPVTVFTTYGSFQINNYDPATGAVNYDFLLAADVDHSAGDITETINLTIRDDFGDTSSVALNIDIRDDAPLAEADTVLASEDGVATSGNITVNDRIGADENTSPVTGVIAGTGTPVSGNIGLAVSGTYGELTLNADGSYTFEIDNTLPSVQGLALGETVSDIFTYEITDGDGSTHTAHITVIVSGANDAPVASADTIILDEDASASGNVLANDSDIDGDELTLTQAQIDLNGDGAVQTLTFGTSTAITDSEGNPIGTITIEADGSFTFEGGANFNGSVPTLNYTLSDGNTGTASAFLDISVTAINDAPIVSSNSITVSEEATDVPLGLDAPSDVDGDTLTITVTNVPTLGIVRLADGSPIMNGQLLTAAEIAGLTYDAPQEYDGVADPGNFTYSVNDGSVTETGTVAITLLAENDAPLVTADPVTTDEDRNVSGSIEIIDADGDEVTASLSIGPENGTVIINSDGSYTYTPALNFNGADRFEIKVDDGNGGVSLATVNVTVTPVNDLPTASADPISTNEDTAISGNVTLNDVDGDTLTVSLSTPAANGTATVNPDGSFTYTPLADFNGEDSFVVQVDDGSGQLVFETVTVTVNPINDAPEVTADPVTTLEDTSVSGSINIVDADGDEVTAMLESGPASGMVTVNTNGSYTYTPDADFNGADSFTIEVTDGEGGISSVTVNVTVDEVNDVIDDAFDGLEDDILSGDLSANDTFAADAIYALDTGPANGDLVFNADGTFTFTPDPDFNGTDGFTYSVTDVNGDVVTRNVSLNIAATSDAPDSASGDLSVSTREDTSVSGQVSASDADGDTLVYSLQTAPVNGTVSVNSDGSYSYTPSPDFNGPDSFIILADDGNGGTLEIIVNIVVNAVNDAPRLVGDGILPDVSAEPGQTINTIQTATAFFEPDADALTYWVTGLPTGLQIDSTTGVISGTLSVDAYDQSPNGDGIYFVQVIVDDGNGGSQSTQFSIQSTAPFVDLSEPDEKQTEFNAASDKSTLAPQPASLLSLLDALDGLNTERAILERFEAILYRSDSADERHHEYRGGHESFETVSGETIIRTMVFQERVFLEIRSVNTASQWEIDTSDTAQNSNWFTYGKANLFVASTELLEPTFTIQLKNLETETLILVEIDVATGTFIIIENISQEELKPGDVPVDKAPDNQVPVEQSPPQTGFSLQLSQAVDGVSNRIRDLVNSDS